MIYADLNNDDWLLFHSERFHMQLKTFRSKLEKLHSKMENFHSTHLVWNDRVPIMK